MNTRFYNCKILTLCKDDEILKNCELWVEGNKIAYIGKPKESPISFDREIDCNGNLVMPSFKNGHGHGIMTFCRSIADDLPLDKWLVFVICIPRLGDENVKKYDGIWQI